jgi:pyruvate dehydrogenase E2 component (dihydrolipoamide acetyltransferase)
MATVVRMPSVLAGASEAAINKWLVAEGAAVVSGEPFAELETEKAVVEYNAELDGTLGRIIIAEGQSAVIGDPIAVVIAAGETEADIEKALADAGVSAAPAGAPVVAEPTAAASAPAETASQASIQPAAYSANETSIHEGRLFASPLARKLAKERGLNLAGVNGSGPGGRIVRRDLENAPAATSSTVTHAVAAPGPVTEIPLTGMRKAIARRLTESKTTVPHFYLTTDCKVDALLSLRKQVNEVGDIKVSVNDLVVMAAAKAFVDVPEANVTWGDTVLLQHSSVDISIAVSTEGGLVTPVLRNAANKSLTQIATEIADLAARGRDKKLKQAELEGGAFSISNLGMYGTKEFSAILNPPQSGILAVGAALQQPVVIDGQLAVATVMTCTLSADHRAIDGALAAQWLAAFTKRIENPVTLLI